MGIMIACTNQVFNNWRKKNKKNFNARTRFDSLCALRNVKEKGIKILSVIFKCGSVWHIYVLWMCMINLNLEKKYTTHENAVKHHQWTCITRRERHDTNVFALLHLLWVFIGVKNALQLYAVVDVASSFFYSSSIPFIDISSSFTMWKQPNINCSCNLFKKTEKKT